MARKDAPRRPPAQEPPAPASANPFGTLTVAGIYFLLAFIYFLPALLPGQHIFGSDYLHGGYYFYEFVADRFGAGSLPKWVPYVYGGVPFFANAGTAFYPFRVLLDLLLPTSKIFPALFIIHFALGGLGMYLLSRELRVRPWIAFVCGLAFQFSGLAMSYVFAGHEGRIIVATLAPMFFFFLHRGVRTGSVGAFLGAAGTMGMALLCNQIQSSYYLLLGGGIWGVFCLVAHRDIGARRIAVRAALGLAAVAFAFSMAAVNFLPFLEYVDESPRGVEGGRGYEYATSWSMEPAEITALAVPEYVGVLDHYQGENPFKLHTEYVGALVVLLLALGVVYGRRNPYWWFFAALALFTLTISLGGNTPIYKLYYELLPGTQRFRAPNISFFLLATSLAVMASLTLEQLAALRDEVGRGRRSTGNPALDPARWIVLGLGGVAVLLTLVAGASAGSQPRDAAFVQGMMRFTIFALALAATLWAWLAGRIGDSVTAILLAAVTVLDLWIVDRRYFDTVPSPAVMFAEDDVANFLLAQPGPFRVWNLPVPPGSVYRNHDDYLMLFDIEQAGGEHGNQLQRFNEFAGAGTEVYVDWHNFIGALREEHSAFLDAANIRYVISMIPLPLPFLREVHRGSALVYENINALPRAYLAQRVEEAPLPDGAVTMMQDTSFDPATAAVIYGSLPEPLPDTPLEGTAEVTLYEPDRVVVQTRSNRAALLVLADNFHKDWRAAVDGEPVPIVRANHTFRGLTVPAGEHEVLFEFRPKRLYIGFAIYLACLSILLAYAVFFLVRSRRRARVATG